MGRTLRAAAFLVVAGCASGPAPKPDEGPAPEPADGTGGGTGVPLSVGTTWVYVDDHGREMKTRIQGAMAVNGRPCVEVRGCAAGISEDRFDDNGVAYWSFGEDRLWLHGVGESSWKLDAREPAPMYQPGAERGWAWHGRFFQRDEAEGREWALGVKFICGGLKRVETPSGTYDAHYVVEEWSEKGEVGVRIETWYAKGMGIVRQIYRRYLHGVPDRTLMLNLKYLLTVKGEKR